MQCTECTGYGCPTGILRAGLAFRRKNLRPPQQPGGFGPTHRDPASRFSSPRQKSAAAAAAGRAQLQSTNLCFGVPC
eukprot:COSAG01_NODE_635_length_14662_cov_12.488773_1_plen_77_part_00